MTTTENPAQVCGCGCGQTPRTNRSKFLPGHDRRLMGMLAHAIRTNQKYLGRDPRVTAGEMFTSAGLIKLESEVNKSKKGKHVADPIGVPT